MAKDAKPTEEKGDAVAPKKKSKKLLVIIAAALVLLLVVGGGGAYLLMKKSSATDEEDPDATEQAPKVEKKKDGKEVAPVYVPLDAFTVNLVSEQGEQFLQLIITAEVEDVKVGDKLKTYTPKLRNNIMLLLSGKKASELITKEGKETLAKEIRDLMNHVLNAGDKKADGPVVEVLFTSFIIQ